MNIEIANRLVQMRKAHGLSQEELANKLGISRQAVSKWERAESSPDTDNLIMLSRLYGVSLDQLLATDDEIPGPEAEEEKPEGDNRARQNVRINLHDGINVTDDDGSKVHIGWDGIFVSDSDGREKAGKDPFINDYINDIEVDDSGVTFTENGERVHREWNSTKDGKRRFIHKQQSSRTGKWRTTIIDENGRKVVLDTDKEIKDTEGRIAHDSGFPFAVLVTGVFLLLGFLKGLWHPAWILFLTIPIYYPIASAIRRNKLNWLDIAVPLLVTGAYAALGIIYDAWHPFWLMLLAIPLYFAVSAAIRGRMGSGSRITGAYTLLTVIVYVTLGIVFGKPAWTVGWLLFLTIPMFSSIINSIRRHVGSRWLIRFPWELLIITGYLFVGLMYGVWHPTWVAFILIPVLRWVIGRIAGVERDGVIVTSEDDDDDDVDEDDDDEDWDD